MVTFPTWLWVRRSLWKHSTLAVLLALIVVLAGCRQSSRTTERLANDTSAAQNLDSNLTFNNISLEQADDQGKTLWKVNAKQATYSPDQKIAKVMQPDGDLFQDGKAIYRIQAQRGEVYQDGQQIVLKGNVIATDLKSNAVLRGDELVWDPKQDLLTVRGNLRGNHPRLKFSADMAQASNRKRQVEISGKVIASTENPDLRMQGDRVVWEIDKQQVISNRPIQIQRVEGKKTTDQANAKQASVNLVNKVVTLKQDARLLLTKPVLEVTSNTLVWNVPQETLVSEEPIKVIYPKRQATLTANQGRMELKPQIAYFTGNVRAIGRQNQAKLNADSLTWNLDTQNVEANGNVTYEQADPPATVKGPKAVGRLDDKSIVVSGGGVVTEIVPQ